MYLLLAALPIVDRLLKQLAKHSDRFISTSFIKPDPNAQRIQNGILVKFIKARVHAFGEICSLFIGNRFQILDDCL
jgi:hypothetical protein